MPILNENRCKVAKFYADQLEFGGLTDRESYMQTFAYNCVDGYRRVLADEEQWKAGVFRDKSDME